MVGAMSSAPTELYRRVNDKGTRYWSIALDGVEVTTASGAKPDRLSTRAKTCKDEGDAARHYHKTRVEKLREGFVLHRELDTVELGGVVTRVALPHAQTDDYFDVTPDGKSLVVTSEQRPSNHRAWLHRVDLAEARTTLLHHVGGSSQTFTHRAQVLGGRHVLFAVNGHTMCVDLESLEVSTVARFGGDAHFNHHCVWPSRSADGSRALVFDAGDVLRVLGSDAQTVLELCVAAPKVECCAAMLSHDGGRVVGYFATRATVYGSDGLTHELRVWEVDTGELVHRIPVPHAVRRCTIASDGATIVALAEYAQGPVFIDLERGERVDFFDDPRRAGCLQTCYTFAHSPDGTRLAIGTSVVGVVDTDDRHGDALELRPDPGAHAEPRHLCFSPSGDVLYVGTTAGEIIGYRVR